MTNECLKVVIILLLSVTLLQGPSLTGQEHYPGCYDENCDYFESCWSLAAFRYEQAKVDAKNTHKDERDACIRDNPHSNTALAVCIAGANAELDRNLEKARKSYCQDKKNCCSRTRLGNPHSGSMYCYYYHSNCPAGCSG